MVGMALSCQLENLFLKQNKAVKAERGKATGRGRSGVERQEGIFCPSAPPGNGYVAEKVHVSTKKMSQGSEQ